MSWKSHGEKEYGEETGETCEGKHDEEKMMYK